MIQHEKSLRRNLDIYLKEITRPRRDLDGKPICPGLAEYKKDIHVLMAETDIESQLCRVCNMLFPLNVPAVIIATTMPPKDIYEITDAALEQHHDIEIFVNDPRKRGAINNVYTGFAHGWLIIVQRQDILQKSRKKIG